MQQIRVLIGLPFVPKWTFAALHAGRRLREPLTAAKIRLNQETLKACCDSIHFAGDVARLLKGMQNSHYFK
jgi:hypothetical protein